MENMGLKNMLFERLKSFYNNKTVLVTGHTGFKGAWLSECLLLLGANVVGYSLEAPTDPSLYKILGLDESIQSIIGDIRDYNNLSRTIYRFSPEVVIHLAAQPIVRASYDNPRDTYETNVMGTVNICEAIRNNISVKSFLNVTTDKVYENKEWIYAYREYETLNGYDPYSNSKSCSELVTKSYINSFFNEMGISVSTARAGNVIGGGDFAKDRIIPDCVRAYINNQTLYIRNPYSIRPYQHVLEAIILYLQIAMEQYGDKTKSGHYNIGPDDTNCVNTLGLVDIFAKNIENSFNYKVIGNPEEPHEATILKLDNSLVKQVFGWKPKYNIENTVKLTVEWTNEWLRENTSENIKKIVDKQIYAYIM